DSFSPTSRPTSVNNSAPDFVSRHDCVASCQPKCIADNDAASQICCAAEWLFTTNFSPSSNSRVRISPARSTSTSSAASRTAFSRLPSLSAARFSKSLIARQPLQGLTVQPHDVPLRQRLRAQALIEVDGQTVPPQHVPAEARAAFGHRDARQLDEEALPH